MTPREIFDKYFLEDVKLIFKEDEAGTEIAILRKEWIYNRFKSKRSHEPKDLYDAIAEYKSDDEKNTRMIESRPDLY